MSVQRTLLIDGNIIYCYDDGSIERYSNAPQHSHNPLRKDFGSNDGRGYRYIKINKKPYKAHKLIAMAFINNPNNYTEVDHINRDKTDNRPCNLRWVTRKMNNDNTFKVENALHKYGYRRCDNRKEYTKAYGSNYRKSHYCLTMINSNGKYTSRVLNLEAYEKLKALPTSERLQAYNKMYFLTEK